ncbi:MAG TPA: hypothetical protein DDY98_04405 [Ruminococcaceae bacterium]|nr:hypothetical protein [Oscillospiraceae bacterium]
MENNTPSTETEQQPKKNSKSPANLISRILLVVIWGIMFAYQIYKGLYKLSVLFGVAFLFFLISLIFTVVKNKKNRKDS